MKALKQHKSKYNFGSLKTIGDGIYVEPEDIYSAMNSLTSYNKRHGTAIVLVPDPLDLDAQDRIKLKVTQIENNPND